MPPGLRRRRTTSRLRHHLAAMKQLAEDSGTLLQQHLPSSLHLAEQMTLPRPLNQDDSGFLVPEDVMMLQELEAKAVGRRDYRLAAHLRDTLDVLTPRPGGPLTLADVAPEGVNAQLSCFWENGFVVLHELLQGEALERARAAWLRAEPTYRDEFLTDAGSAASNGEASFVYGIPNLMELDDVFIDLSDHPKLVGVMQHLAGAGGLDDDESLVDRRYHGVMRLGGGGIVGNVVTSAAADGKQNELGYTMW